MPPLLSSSSSEGEHHHGLILFCYHRAAQSWVATIAGQRTPVSTNTERTRAMALQDVGDLKDKGNNLKELKDNYDKAQGGEKVEEDSR